MSLPQFKELLEKTNNRVTEDREEQAAAAEASSQGASSSASVRPIPPTLCALTARMLNLHECVVPQAAQALENAVDGLGSDGESASAATGIQPRKRKGKPFPEVKIPPRPGMKNVSALCTAACLR
eukprot:COSAG02_NODE_3141_length_7293_cov_3.120795_5_plen_125_part_00